MEAVKEKDLKICVSIYPDGIQPKDSEKVEMPASVNFKTPEEKESYVVQEYRFCKRQFSEYEAAISREDRFRARERLQSGRVNFAKSQNFGPGLDGRGKVKDRWEWHYQGRDEPTELA